MDFLNLLGGDPSDNTFGSAPKIPLLRKPAAWKGFGVDQLSKRDTFKTDYTSGFTKSLNGKTTAGLSPTAMAGGMKGNLAGTMGKQTGSALPNPKGGGFLSNNAGLLASGAIGGATSILSAYSDPNATAASKDAAAVSGLADTASSTLMSSGNPIGMVAGAAIKGIDMVGKPLFNAALYKGLANFDKNTNKAVTESSGFGGIGASAEGISKDVSDYKKFGSFGKATYFASGKMNRMKREADRNIKLQGEASKILNKNKSAVEAAAVGAGDATTRNMYEKYNPNMYDSIQFGKDGIKLKDIRTFRLGGKINVIVNGKLHKELHHMDMDDVTKKGVPVVTMEDGGEVVQHAEVERDEMILHLELTKKLEELKEEGSDDSMIEAGKLLAYEIVKNTKDSKNKIIKNA